MRNSRARVRSPGVMLLAAATVASCAVGPTYHRPDVHMPEQYAAVQPPAARAAEPAGAAQSGASQSGAARPAEPAGAAQPGASQSGAPQPDAAQAQAEAFHPAAQPPAAGQAPPVDFDGWWRSLHDPLLESLIDRALKGNPDLQIALDHLQAARTYEIAVVGTALPDVQVSGASGRGTGSDLSRSRADQSLISADHSSGLRHINSVGGFDSLWEIDLFGKYRRTMQAARHDEQAIAARRNVVLVSVIADVARAYIDLRGLQVRASILRASIDALRESQHVARERYERGITNELDLTLATRELGVREAQVAPVNAQINAAEYTIATLLGLYPEELIAELSPPALIPTVPAAVQSGMPLELLRRRPEVLEAEQQLAGATARVGIATASLFPRVSISGALGFQRQTTPELGEHIWSAGIGAMWPLLDFGSLDAQVEIADLNTRALLVSYRRTIQNAVKEVDTTWGSFAAEQDSLVKLGEALAASQRAVELANERYVRGLTDYLNLVDAQRQEYDIEAQYSLAQQAAAEQFVALYRSLGGGWESYQALPPAHFPEPAVVAAFHRVLSGSDVLK